MVISRYGWWPDECPMTDNWMPNKRKHQSKRTVFDMQAEIERLQHDAENHLRAYQAMFNENTQLRAALGELLSGHDNLYVAHFGPESNPHDDIAAKPARSLLTTKVG